MSAHVPDREEVPEVVGERQASGPLRCADTRFVGGWAERRCDEPRRASKALRERAEARDGERDAVPARRAHEGLLGALGPMCAVKVAATSPFVSARAARSISASVSQ